MFSLEGGEGGTLISDIANIRDRKNSTISSLLYWKNGFGKNFVYWVEVSLNNQESYVINGGSTTRYL